MWHVGRVQSCARLGMQLPALPSAVQMHLLENRAFKQVTHITMVEFSRTNEEGKEGYSEGQTIKSRESQSGMGF